MASKVAVDWFDGEIYRFDFEYGEILCAHANAYIEPACCNGVDSGGNPSCACRGVDQVVCPNPDCTGIKDHEVEELFDRLGQEI